MNIMDELRVEYERQLKEYDDALETALQTDDTSKLPILREMNNKISNTLNRMIEKITFLKKDTPDINKERDALIRRLQQIQKDYNGLLVNTDNLETLRRIRQEESSESNRQLYMYVGFFLVICFAIVIYLSFVAHKKDTTAAIARRPPTAAALV